MLIEDINTRLYCDILVIPGYNIVIPGYIAIPDQYVDTHIYVLLISTKSKLMCIVLEASDYLTTIQCNKRSADGSAQREF